MKLTINIFGRASVEYEREPMSKERFDLLIGLVYMAVGIVGFLGFIAVLHAAIGG